MINNPLRACVVEVGIIRMRRAIWTCLAVCAAPSGLRHVGIEQDVVTIELVQSENGKYSLYIVP